MVVVRHSAAPAPTEDVVVDTKARSRKSKKPEDPAPDAFSASAKEE